MICIFSINCVFITSDFLYVSCRFSETLPVQKRLAPVYSKTCKYFSQFVICYLTLLMFFKQVFVRVPGFQFFWIYTILSYSKEYLDREQNCSPCCSALTAVQVLLQCNTLSECMGEGLLQLTTPFIILGGSKCKWEAT